MAAADTAKLVAVLTLNAKGFQSALSKADKSLGKLESTGFRVGQNIGGGLKAAGHNIGVGVAALSAAAVGGFAASVAVAADFEAQLQTINTVAMASPEALKGIGDSIRKLARDTGTSTDDLTAAFYDLVSAGIDAADAQNVLTQANTLAIGGLSTTSEAVDLLTTAINTYGGDASQAAKDTDIFAKTIERGKVTAADLAASFATVGPIAAAAGISIEELGAAYAQLTATGIPAAEAATDTRSAILALTKMTPQLEKLQKSTRHNYAAIADKKGLVAALQLLRDDADKAGVPVTDLLGRVEALQFFTATTGPNLASYSENLAAMGDAAGTAAAQMGEREKGLRAQLQKLKALVKDAGITIGTALLPALTDLVTKASDFINLPTTQAGISKLATDIAAAFKEAAAVIGKIDWAVVGTSLKIAGTGAKAVFTAFTSLPAWVQTAVLTGWGLNKLTGGALGGIVGELGKGLIKGVLSMNAGVVHINAASVTGVGGGGLGGAAGAAAGVAGGLGVAAGSAALIGVVITGVAQTAAANLAGAFATALSGDPNIGKGVQQVQTDLGAQGPFNVAGIIDRAQRALSGDFRSGLEVATQSATSKLVGKFDGLSAQIGGASIEDRDASNALLQAQKEGAAAVASAIRPVPPAVDLVRQSIESAKARNASDSQSERASIASAAQAQAAATSAAGARTAAAGQAAAAAIRDKDLSVRVQNFNTVTTTVSVKDTIKATQKYHSVYRVAS